MNYKSELRGWAFDRATEAAKVAKRDAGIGELMQDAEALADWAYIPDKDFRDTIAHLSGLLKQIEDPLAAVEQLLAELNVMREDIERQVQMRNVATEH